MSGKTIMWDRDKLAALKAAYQEAVKNRQGSFMFIEKEGTGFMEKTLAEHPMDLRYARYLIEYLDGEFARHPDQPAQPNREGEEGQ